MDSVYVIFVEYNLKNSNARHVPIIHCQTVVDIKHVGMFTNKLQFKFHIPSSSGSLVIVTKPTAQQILRKTVMFLFRVGQNITFKPCIFLRCLTRHLSGEL